MPGVDGVTLADRLSMTKTLAQIVGTIVDELTPLGSDARRRAIQAAMTLLGEEPIKSPRVDDELDKVEGAQSLAARSVAWMRQNEISMEQLQHTFLIENGSVEIIAQIQGGSNREKVRNVYVLVGIANFIRTGDQKFDDADARSLCERFGIYDSTNHSKYMKGGNEFTGSREKGWTLTMPGLKVGANLVKEAGG
jgi:hypothetical protein